MNAEIEWIQFHVFIEFNFSHDVYVILKQTTFLSLVHKQKHSIAIPPGCPKEIKTISPTNLKSSHFYFIFCTKILFSPLRQKLFRSCQKAIHFLPTFLSRSFLGLFFIIKFTLFLSERFELNIYSLRCRIPTTVS